MYHLCTAACVPVLKLAAISQCRNTFIYPKNFLCPVSVNILIHSSWGTLLSNYSLFICPAISNIIYWSLNELIFKTTNNSEMEIKINDIEYPSILIREIILQNNKILVSLNCNKNLDYTFNDYKNAEKIFRNIVEKMIHRANHKARLW